MPENPVRKMSHRHPAFEKSGRSVTSSFLESAPSMRAMGFSSPGLALASSVEWRRAELVYLHHGCRKARFSGPRQG